MKKICIITALVCAASVVQAITINTGTTINAPAALVGVNALNGANAYSWAIAPTVASGATIDSATINFNNITLTVGNSSGTGFLYTDLLKLGGSGVTTYTDNDAAGDYFAGKFSNVSLGSQFFSSVGTTLSWSYVFTGAQLSSLNNFFSNGGFSLGFDPDCHYTVGGLSFSYTTKSNSVPDGATTAWLLGAGLLGMEVFRRKLAPAVKA